MSTGFSVDGCEEVETRFGRSGEISRAPLPGAARLSLLQTAGEGRARFARDCVRRKTGGGALPQPREGQSRAPGLRHESPRRRREGGLWAVLAASSIAF